MQSVFVKCRSVEERDQMLEFLERNFHGFRFEGKLLRIEGPTKTPKGLGRTRKPSIGFDYVEDLGYYCARGLCLWIMRMLDLREVQDYDGPIPLSLSHAFIYSPPSMTRRKRWGGTGSMLASPDYVKIVVGELERLTNAWFLEKGSKDCLLPEDEEKAILKIPEVKKICNGGNYVAIQCKIGRFDPPYWLLLKVRGPGSRFRIFGPRVPFSSWTGFVCLGNMNRGLSHYLREGDFALATTLLVSFIKKARRE